jgi:hypothetical protein
MDITFIIELEKKLLKNSIRKKTEELNNLLHEEFIEFSTSGKVYNKKMIIEMLAAENPIEIEASDFESIQLAPNIIQLRFKTQKNNQDGSIVTTLRSSIWKLENSKWQMIFHQGTKI